METLRANPYFVGITTALAVYLGILVVKKIFFSQVEKISTRTANRLDDIFIYSLAHTTHLFMFVSALYVGFQFMPEHEKYPTWSWRIFFCALMIQIGIWGSYFIKKWMQLSFTRKRKRDPAAATSIGILELMLKAVFLGLILMFTLNNLGIQVTTMIAGLGIGGVAIALAMQNILGDLFSSLSIILDKPFVVGDFIIMGEWLGEVESIGLKTTRIRSLSGEQIIISNSDLLGSRIRNYKRMHERRNVVTFSLPHGTSRAQLKEAVESIAAVVQSKDRVRFDRCHYFRITPNSLDIELVYFILDPDYNIHMDILQDILFDIHDLFKAQGIPYATPIQKFQFAETQNWPGLRPQKESEKGHSLT